jgi:hypothetical protein
MVPAEVEETVSVAWTTGPDGVGCAFPVAGGVVETDADVELHAETRDVAANAAAAWSIWRRVWKDRLGRPDLSG